MRDQIHIIGGGTFFHVRPHLALAAPAFGTTAYDIAGALEMADYEGEIHLYTTMMAGNVFSALKMENVCNSAIPWKQHITNPVQFSEDDPRSSDEYGPNLVTNDDVLKLVLQIVANPRAKILFMPVALCDFQGFVLGPPQPLVEPMGIDDTLPMVREKTPSGKNQPRLKSHLDHTIALEQAPKVISRIRKERKDLFLVGFKTTAGASKDEQFEAGLKLLKESSCNLVLANDLRTRMNMVITPEQARYSVTADREEALTMLVDMALSRSSGTFTRSSVVKDSSTVPWGSEEVPESLRVVVDYLRARGAYRPFLGKTVGHFAAKLSDGLFLTSLRGTDFNKLDETGMAKVMVVDDTRVSVLGGKPSVGGQSQRIIFAEHPKIDCIVHFHCPLKNVDRIKTQVQWPYECGSHECGKNTSNGLELWTVDKDGNELKAVMLDKHGPNICFSKNFDPQKVIEFIERNWDVTRQTSES